MSRKSSQREAPAPLPQRNWENLFGYDSDFEDMLALMGRDRWPQSFLMEGREGIGKRTLLAKLCAAMYCKTHNACGHCDACRAVCSGYHPDLLWIEAEGAIKVAEADQIQDHLNYRASSGTAEESWRIAVIINIEELTDQAANRLLKTLEEPPAQSRLLLSCSRPRQLLPTIMSRLVRWHLKPPAADLSLAWMQKKASEAGFQVEPSILAETLAGHGFSPGRAWHFLELEHGGLGQTLDALEDILLAPFDGRRLQELQDLIKQAGWKADEFAQLFERILNRCYKAQFALNGRTPRGAQLAHERLRQWRRILQQVYRAGGSGHNYLNTQMVAEALLSG